MIAPFEVDEVSAQLHCAHILVLHRTAVPQPAHFVGKAAVGGHLIAGAVSRGAAARVRTTVSVVIGLAESRTGMPLSHQISQRNRIADGRSLERRYPHAARH